MVQKMVSIGFVFVLVLMLGLPVEAAQGGAITVSLDAGELPVNNGAMTLYRVGNPAEEGYRITELFGGGMVKAEDAASPHLALWLAEGAGASGKTIYLDVDGNVTFSNLPDGLYLLMQTEQMDGFHAIQPFLVTIPMGGERQVHFYLETRPIIADENPQTGDPIGPLLGAMGMVASGVGLYLCVEKKRK